MTEQKGKRYQGIPAIEAFEYQNKRSDIKCCADGEKWKKKKKKARVQLSISEAQGPFSDKVAIGIDVFTD